MYPMQICNAEQFEEDMHISVHFQGPVVVVSAGFRPLLNYPSLQGNVQRHYGSDDDVQTHLPQDFRIVIATGDCRRFAPTKPIKGKDMVQHRSAQVYETGHLLRHVMSRMDMNAMTTQESEAWHKMYNVVSRLVFNKSHPTYLQTKTCHQTYNLTFCGFIISGTPKCSGRSANVISSCTLGLPCAVSRQKRHLSRPRE